MTTPVKTDPKLTAPDCPLPSSNIAQPVMAATAAVLGATAAIVTASAHETERLHPPAGRFVDVSGVRVHYLDEGNGPPLVLVHGNAMSSDDFVASNIVAPLAKRHRVIVFDRPGFGYSARPRGVDWTPIRQAELIHEALGKLKVRDPIVVGHSLGSLVAVALAIAHPEDALGLVLLSGYYYASMPLEMRLLSATALPVVGDVMRFTASPVLGRLFESPMVQQLFAPAPVAETFARYPLSMSRRPSQIRATMEDAKFMDPAALELQERYGELTLPVEILAGDGDLIVSTATQSERLAGALPNAHFGTIKGAGHMIHYTAPDRVLEAIDMVEARLQTLAA